MHAGDIILALKNKFKNKMEYSFFTEVRTATGAQRRIGSIDAMVIGLWSRDSNIYALEIKVSKQDFLSDVKHFEQKQKFAMDNSNLFFYVTPAGLLSPDEVPEGAGLMEVQKGGRVVTKKMAKRRDIKDINISLLRSLSRRLLEDEKAIDYKHSIKFLGKDTTPEAVDEYIDKEVSRRIEERSDYEVTRQVNERVNYEMSKVPEYQKVLDLAGVFDFYIPGSISEDRLKNITGKLKKMAEIMSCLDLYQRRFQDAADLVDEINKITNDGE
jgi:hypothetical protein